MHYSMTLSFEQMQYHNVNDKEEASALITTDRYAVYLSAATLTLSQSECSIYYVGIYSEGGGSID